MPDEAKIEIEHEADEVSTDPEKVADDPEKNWAVLTGTLLAQGLCPLCSHPAEFHEGDDCVRSTLFSAPSCSVCRERMVQAFSLIVAPGP